MMNFNFVDRTSDNPNRRRLTIIEQTGNSMIADIDMSEFTKTAGTSINANIMTTFQTNINTANENANTAKSQANSAVSTANTANGKSENAISIANQAESEAGDAKDVADEALSKANEALNQVVQMQGTKIYINNSSTPESRVDFTSDPQTQVNNINTTLSEHTTILNNHTNKLNEHSNSITQINNKFNNYLPLTGGTINGTLNLTTLNVNTINLQ